MAHKKYSVEFKKNALEQLKGGGKTVTQIERELDITYGLLRDWEAKWSVTGKPLMNETSHNNAGLYPIHSDLKQ